MPHAQDAHDPRRSCRHPLSTLALLDDGHGSFPLPVLEVSREAVFVASDLLLEEGERYALSFTLPRTPGILRAQGEVVRVQGSMRQPPCGEARRSGMALRFVGLEPASVRALDRWLTVADASEVGLPRAGSRQPSAQPSSTSERRACCSSALVAGASSSKA